VTVARTQSATEEGNERERPAVTDLTHIDFSSFPAAHWFLDDIQKAIANPRAPYTPHGGDGQILEELRGRLGSVLQRTIQPGEIMLTTGVQNGIYLALKSLIRPGDRVAVPDPDYMLAQETAESAGATVVRVPVGWSTGAAEPEPGALASAAEDPVRAFFFTSPCNPTGAIWSAETLSTLASTLVSPDGYLIADELYSRVVYGGRFRHAAGLPGLEHRVVTLLGPSKVESLSGFRIGVAVGPDDVIASMTTHMRLVTLRAPAYAQFSLRQWYSAQDEAFMADRTARFQRVRDLAVDRLGRIEGVSVIAPAGGVYLLAQVRGSGSRLAEALEQAGILVTDGRIFGRAGESGIRICFAHQEERLLVALDQMAAIIADLEGQKP
jgi:aspartate/methionine/tyrosine aminotransferase